MSRKPKTLKIIGINPGTKYTGIAVLSGLELRNWMIRASNGIWTNEKAKRTLATISGFIDQYDSNTLAIKKLHRSRSSLELKNFVIKIKRFAKRRGLKVYEYSIDEIKKAYCPDSRINKRKLAEIVAWEYPELAPELEKDQNQKNPYYFRVMEAVALGSVCFHKLDDKSTKRGQSPRFYQYA